MKPPCSPETAFSTGEGGTDGKWVSTCSTWLPAGVSLAGALLPLLPTPPSLLPTSFWSPEGEVETRPAHSGLPFAALISWAGIPRACRRAVVLLPLCLDLGKVSRCVLAFRSGSWMVRSRTSSSWWGRELFSVSPATHVVTVSIFHFKSKQMDWGIFFFFF